MEEIEVMVMDMDVDVVKTSKTGGDVLIILQRGKTHLITKG